MTELHIYHQVRDIPLESFPVSPSVQMLLTVLHGMQQWMQSVPRVSRDSEQGSGVCLLFRDSACAAEDLLQQFGSELAALSRRWRVDLYGTEPLSQETVWYRVTEEEGQSRARESSLSGRSAETLRSPCLCLSCAESGAVQALVQLFQAMDWNHGIAAMDRVFSEWLGEECRPYRSEPGLYCYEGIDPVPEPEQCLAALRLEQKVRLWISFLDEDRECVEFCWLYDAILHHTLENRIEWELSLYQALKQLGYTVQADPERFMLRDGQGRPRYFSADGFRNSERSLMKLLFPLNFRD